MIRFKYNDKRVKTDVKEIIKKYPIIKKIIYFVIKNNHINELVIEKIDFQTESNTISLSITTIGEIGNIKCKTLSLIIDIDIESNIFTIKKVGCNNYQEFSMTSFNILETIYQNEDNTRSFARGYGVNGNKYQDLDYEYRKYSCYRYNYYDNNLNLYFSICIVPKTDNNSEIFINENKMGYLLTNDNIKISNLEELYQVIETCVPKKGVLIKISDYNNSNNSIIVDKGEINVFKTDIDNLENKDSSIIKK